jgi:hypothetical protein
MPKHKTDLTPVHWPHEYEVLAPEGHPICIGTKEQCEGKLEEIKHFDAEYGNACKIRKA